MWKLHTSKILGSSCLFSFIPFIQSTNKSCWHHPHNSLSHHNPSSRLLQQSSTYSRLFHPMPDFSTALVDSSSHTTSVPTWSIPCSLKVFCTTISAGLQQKPWSAEEKLLPSRATVNQLGQQSVDTCPSSPPLEMKNRREKRGKEWGNNFVN